MNKDLAKLIREHKEEILPYLLIRSEYVLQGTLHRSEAESLVGSEAFCLLLDSEYILLDSGDTVLFKDGDRWLPDSKEPGKRPATKQSNYDKQIEHLARVSGFPVDFFYNMGRYRQMYQNILNMGDRFSDIESIAYENEGIGLDNLLTLSTYKALKRTYKNETE